MNLRLYQVEFVKDYANRKAGDVIEVDSRLAGILVNREKVAKYHKATSRRKSAPKTEE